MNEAYPRAPRCFWPTMVVTVILANAAIMTLELVAGRLVARYLGQSLYTWTSIIGVVLAGMAIGSFLGGNLADRKPPRKLLSQVLALAALGSFCILLLNSVAGTWQSLREFSWPLRIFLHTSLTFLAPCILLGAINPIIAQFALSKTQHRGRGLGVIYASAALGSIGGTFLAGFYLIMVFGSTVIICAVGGILAVLAILYALWAYRSQEKNDDMTQAFPTAQSQKSGGSLMVKACSTVFLSNAAFMVLELAASRMATQHLGHSLYTWTTLLGGVLAGVTLGNYLGGRLADRFDAKSLLSILFLLSATVCLFVPAANITLASATWLDPLPWVWRIIWHVLFAFAIPAVCIGTIGPVAAKMALEGNRPAGKTLGAIYAWGALGSVVGTFLTGFILIDLIWPTGTLTLLAFVLALSGLLYRSSSRTAWSIVGVCLVAVAAALLPWPATVGLGRMLGLRDAQDQGLIYEDHSQYSRIAIHQNTAAPHLRELHLDQLLHSTVNLDEPTQLLYDYQWIYEAVLNTRFGKGRPVKSMMLGGGGYTFPRFIELSRAGSQTDVVEIDPAVTEAARRAFGFAEDSAIDVYTMDARNRIEDLLRLKRGNSEFQTFDVVFGDSFNQYSVPFQLTTLEFTQAISELLGPDGLYMLNMIDNPQDGIFLGSIIHTCRRVFPTVEVFSCADEDRTARDTFVVVCAKAPLELQSLEQRMRGKYQYEGALLTQAALDTWVQRGGNRVLSDDFAPVDNLLARLANTQHTWRGVDSAVTTASLLAQGRGEEAINKIRDALSEAPEDDDIQHHYGTTLARMGKLEEAIVVFEDILTREPDNHEMHYNLGTALAESKRLEAAIPHYEASLRGETSRWEAHFVLGQYRAGKGNLDKAVTHLEETIKLAPENGYAYYLLGRFYDRRKQHSQAVKQFSQAADLLPENADVQFSLGMAWVVSKNLNKAKFHLENALRLNPDFLAAAMNLGNIHFENGDLAEACGNYLIAVRIAPDNAMAHYNLGNALVRRGDLQEGLEHLEEALRLQPDLEAAKEALEKARSALSSSL